MKEQVYSDAKRRVDEAEALERIRAAAPNLLAALEECRYALSKANDQYEADKGRRSTLLDSRIRLAEDAIAKAKEA